MMLLNANPKIYVFTFNALNMQISTLTVANLVERMSGTTDKQFDFKRAWYWIKQTLNKLPALQWGFSFKQLKQVEIQPFSVTTANQDHVNWLKL